MIPNIDPRVDYAFKRVFGHEHNIPLLAGLLDAVLQPPPEQRLVELTLLNPFNDKETFDDKLSILDIKARDQTGKQINIEMQLLAHVILRPRVLYYWSKFHQSQLQEGQDYHNLRPTISVCFVNTPLFLEADRYHLIFELLERQQHFAFSDQMQLHILELANFKKPAAQLQTPLDRWLYFLCHGKELDPYALPPELNDPSIRRALEVLGAMNQSAAERERYEARQKYYHDMATWERELRDAREGLKTALKQGHDEGLKQGRDEGLKEGRDEGLKQGQVIGRIHLCQRLLHRTLTAQEELRLRPIAELESLAAALEAELTNAAGSSSKPE